MPSCGMTVLLDYPLIVCVLHAADHLHVQSCHRSLKFAELVASWEAFLHQGPYGAHGWGPPSLQYAMIV